MIRAPFVGSDAQLHSVGIGMLGLDDLWSLTPLIGRFYLTTFVSMCGFLSILVGVCVILYMNAIS